MSSSEIVCRQQALACLRARLLWLVGCLGLLLTVVAVWGLLAVNSANQRQQQALATATQLLGTVDEVRQGQVTFKKQVQEWKDVRLRGGGAADYLSYWTAFESEDKEVNRDLAAARAKLVELQFSTTLLDKFLASHVVLDAAYRAAIKNYVPGDAASMLAVDRQVRGMDREPTDLLDTYVANLVAASKTRITQMAEASRNDVDFDKKFRELMLLAVTAGIALAVVFSVRSLARVEEILENAQGTGA
jgi:hypothetical protein